MVEKVTTVRMEEKKVVIICDFCGKEMSPSGCCGHTDWAKCDVCEKHLCNKTTCRKTITIESGWGDDPDWEVCLCPDHWNPVTVERVMRFKDDRNKTSDEYNDKMERMKREFYEWLSEQKGRQDHDR